MKRLVRGVLAAAALFLLGYAYDRYWRAPSEEDLERLRQQRRILNGRLEERLAVELHALDAPDAGVIVGVPRAFAQRFAGELAARLFSDVRLRLQDVQVRKEGEIRARILVGRSQLGTFDLSVDLDEVSGVLRAGKPVLEFAEQRVRVVLPVSLVEGSGRGRVRFHWDARGVAKAVCGDLDMAGAVAGRVVPESTTLTGSFALALEGSRLVARPLFEEAVLRLRVEPTDETWRLVEKTIAEQGAVCRAALRSADVPGRVRALLDRGFDVKLPRKPLPEARLPVDLEQAVDLEGKPVRVEVSPAGLAVTPSEIWYGARVSLEDAPP